MKSIRKEQILRLNCPGYGEDSYLTMGRAKSLDNYDVIVANPVSILHLFDRDQDVLKDVNSKLDEGLTSFTLKNDGLLQSLESDLKKRIFELVSFLERGGLLIYYLCRPFLLQGNSLSMDNYFWLESLAPDTPVENNVRHMSAVSHGRTIDPTDQADRSEFASYFKQPGLEWNTIIRTDFLTEGYIVLATAGPRKCIAAHLIAGDNGGRILFLPAPYSPDFDRTLIDCVNNWYNNREAAAGNLETEPTVSVVAEASSAAASAQASLPRFPQPDSDFLKPEPLEEPPKSAASNKHLSASRSGMTSIRSSRTGMPAQNPNSSRTGLPPVQKFDARTSRNQPGSDERATAEDILDSVEANAGDLTPVLSEHTTSDIGAAFQTLNDPLPQLPPQAGPTASDLLKELEVVAPGDSSGRNLLKEMEDLSVKPVSVPVFEPSVPVFETAVPVFEPVPEPERSQPDLGKPEGYTYWSQSPPSETAKTVASEPEPKSPAVPVSQNIEPVVGEAKWVPEPAQKRQPEPTASDADVPKNQPTEQKLSSHRDDANNNGEQVPEAKDLMKKMENMTKTVGTEWCNDYSFPDLEELKREKSQLTDAIRQTQAKIAALENKISQLDGLKNALLGSEGEELMGACSRVFKRLGWTAKPSDMDELLLSMEHPEALARIVRTTNALRGTDLAPLAQSVITHWGEHEVEPKGVFVACTWANRAPIERGEPDFTDALAEFAQKKSLCLMTTMQLLCMYRDLELGKVSAEEIRRRIVETNGRLQGFSLESAMTKATAG